MALEVSRSIWASLAHTRARSPDRWANPSAPFPPARSLPPADAEPRPCVPTSPFPHFVLLIEAAVHMKKI
eukprot:scaffold13277_cov114-Isochrysis_galbana.AAC.10